MPEVRFVELPDAATAALLDGDGDLERASAEAGVALTGFFTTELARWLWRLRAGQLAADPRPDSRPWIARSAVTDAAGRIVGHAGFHGPPDSGGTVEVGYAVLPECRRRGYARAILTELLRRAAAAPGVRTVRASISPDNAGSLATIAGFGFTRTGEQWDEEDGLQFVFEVPAARRP